MGWDKRYCISSLKDKHTMHSVTQKNILQHLGLFVMSKCHKRWNKERSSLRLRQLEEALCCAANAFGNNRQQGKVFSFWFSWAWGLQDMKLSQVIINTCNMHQMRSLKSMTWALVFGEHPIQWPSHLSSAPYTTYLTRAGLPPFVYTDAQLSWMSLHTKPGFSSCCLHQKLTEDRPHDGKNTTPWWGVGPQHPVCVLWEQGNCISWGGKTGWENAFS